jgi:adenylyl- and sulfurtransferase ThiI
MLQPNLEDNERKRAEKNVRMLIRVTDRALGRLSKRSNTVFGVHEVQCACKVEKKK